MSVFNGERFLREAIDSILCQSVRDLEFVIVDDGSTDQSGQILKEISKVDPRVRVYSQSNYGLATALNRGCAAANGRYLARMDADDVSLPDRLRTQIEVLEKHPEIAVVGGRVECIDSRGRTLRKEPSVLDSQHIKAALDRGDCVITHPTVLIRKEVFERVGGYRRSVIDAEDYDLWLRIAEHHDLANVDKVVLKYRRHDAQVSIRRFRQQALSNLAARTAAQKRRSGSEDPLNSIDVINERSLADMGVAYVVQRGTVARAYMTSIGNLSDSGNVNEAFNLLERMQTDVDVLELASNQIGDFHFLCARVRWKRGEYRMSIREFVKAIVAYPMALARPMKPLVRLVRR